MEVCNAVGNISLCFATVKIKKSSKQPDRVRIFRICKHKSMDLSRNEQGKIEFNELVPNTTVRFTVLDGVQYLSIRDLIVVVCEQNEKRACETWKLLSEERKSEVSEKIRKFKFTGKYQHTQPVITFPGAVMLMMWLSGNKAKSFRAKVTEIITRYFAGDKSLLRDLHANAESNSPINEAARASLQSEAAAQTSLGQPEKRQKLCVPTPEELERCREFTQFMSVLSEGNRHYREFIELRREDADVDVNKQERLMQISLKEMSEKSKIQNKMNRDELIYKRALKALEAPPAPAPAVPAAIPDPQDLTTVLKVYLNNKDLFSLLKPEQRKGFLIRAGHAAAEAYTMQYGIPPSKLDEQGHDVNAFPPYAEPMVMQALRTAYRESTAGNSQTTLDASFFRQGQALA